MSDLQLALIVLGVIAVGAVAMYNIWQERQFRRRSEKALPAAGSDALLEAGGQPEARGRREPVLGEQRVEPALAAQPWTAEVADPGPVLRPDPRAEPAPEPAAAAQHGSPGPAAGAARGRGMLVPAGALAGPAGLWYPMVFRLPASVDGPTLAGIRAVVAAEGRIAEWLQPEAAAPLADAGRAEDDAAQGAAPATVDRVLRVQAVDAHGPASAGELARLLLTAEEAAERIGGEAVAPEPSASAEAAAGLHEFCSSVDVAIGLNVATTGGGFSGTKLRGVIEAAGFRALPDHSYLLSDEAGNTLCTLTDGNGDGLDPQALKAQAIRAISLALDVPRTPGALAQFERTANLARQFAQALSGRVVDDSGQPLDDASIARIRSQLASMVNAMRARGIEPGEAIARRVFG